MSIQSRAKSLVGGGHLRQEWTMSEPKCTTASQPQSLAIAVESQSKSQGISAARSKFGYFFIAKCIATATVSLPQRNRNLFPRKNRCVQFDRVNESQASTANRLQETVHLGQNLPYLAVLHGVALSLSISCPSFPLFFCWTSLFSCLLLARIFLVCFFPSFPGILGVRWGYEILVFFCGLPCAFQQKNQGRIGFTRPQVLK